MNSSNNSSSLVERYLKYGPYGYQPNLEAGIIFATVYAIFASVFIFRSILHRQWWLLSTLGLAGVFECAGSAIRIVSHFNSQNVNAYIAQEVILVLTPAYIAAAHFTILSKICQECGECFIYPMKMKWMIPFFICVDVISLLIQGAGSGLAASAGLGVTPISQINNYGDIVVGGLALQLLGYLVFNLFYFLFAYRTSHSQDQIIMQIWTTKFKRFYFAVWLSAGCIIIRSTFRTVEMAVGWVGIVAATEWYFLVFDATFVSLSLLILLVVSPTKHIPLQSQSMDLADPDMSVQSKA